MESRLNRADPVHRGPKFLLIRPGALGDTLLTLPALAKASRSASVYLAGRKPGISFARRWAADVFDMEGGGWYKLFGQRWPGNEKLAPLEPDVVTALFSNPGPLLERNLRNCFPSASVTIQPSLPSEASGVHVAEHVAACLARAGWPLNTERVLADSLEEGLLSPCPPRPPAKGLVFHPGSGSAKKNLEDAFWAALGSEKPVCLLGPAEHSSSFMHRNTEAIRTIVCPDTETLTAHIARARLFMGHDSGVTHLAAMLGTPTIAFFRMPNIQLWRPLGPAVMVILEHQNRENLLDSALAHAAELTGKSP